MTPGWTAGKVSLAGRRQRLNTQVLLHPGSLESELTQTRHRRSVSPESTGKMGGKLMVGIGYSGEFADDQQADDEQSLVFDTLPT